ncbi:hypothetical protein [Pseudomonas sp. A-R-26]|uniref:hypothetical protein n=1 Tax=Pseudomonas sp. A-R-26 TaxID=2832404 RepID=UPI001CC12BF7|nr:hypothetical protein [Pseudomonas sp. A-R-26]
MTDKIVIHGTPRKYNDDELKQLQEDYHRMYKQSAQCLELVQADFPYELIATIIEKSKLGYELCKWSPIRTLSLDYSASMIKPEELQKLDLAVIDADVKAQYVKELEVEREKYRQLLTEQLLQKAELAEAKKVADKRAKLLAEVQREVDSVFTELEIPV